jgi:hypothetical protein
VLSDDPYGELIPSFSSLGQIVGRWPAWAGSVVGRVGPLRAIIFLLLGTRYDVLTVLREQRGWRSLLLLSAVMPSRRKLAVFHFIDHPPRSEGRGATVDRLWRPIERWAVRRGVLRAQVFSVSEPALYAHRFGVAQDRFRFVPYPWRYPPRDASPGFRPAAQREGVIAAGRSFCDWPTLFQAARGEDWTLTVVCQAADRPLVERLNAPPLATILSELSADETRKRLGQAALSAVTMYDSGVSQGHTRLCDCVNAGAPVVVSQTRSLEGYVEPGETASVVPPGDPEALRQAINRLLADPAARDEMARAAWIRAGAWTWEDYLDAISAFVYGGPDRFGQAAAASAADASLAVPSSEPPEDSRREMTFETPSPPMETP